MDSLSDNNIMRLLFIGAGKIAQSVIKGLKGYNPKQLQILAIAPSRNNLDKLKNANVQTCLTNDYQYIAKFQPNVVFLCIKPQIFQQKVEPLTTVLKGIPTNCIVVSVMAGLTTQYIHSSMSSHFPSVNIIRAMFNVAAELQQTNAFLYISPNIGKEYAEKIQSLFEVFAPTTTVLQDEKLIDVCTGVTGSGIAFMFEIIQAVSDISVKNGLSRQDSLQAAAQLSIAAGKMCLKTNKHPYQLRDSVSSPAGSTVYGLSTWHENAINDRIGKSIQTSIDRAKYLSGNTDKT